MSKDCLTLDQFYTNNDISIKCYNKLKEMVNIESYDNIIEPSAGNGSFYNLLNKEKRIGIDLEPKCDGLVKMDYLEFIHDLNKRYLVIGNPPFGKVSSLAVKFFNKSKYADCIAFIIPRTFKRVSIQNKLDLNFHIIYNEDLPLNPCCFTPKMSAKCCFQIWVKKDTPRELVKYDKTHSDFEFLKHGPKDKNNQPTSPIGADFAIKAYGSNCGKIQEKVLDTLSAKSWHWIKSNIDIETLKKRFSDLDCSISLDTVRQESLGQKELINLYSKANTGVSLKVFS
jgi:hypothetical protein